MIRLIYSFCFITCFLCSISFSHATTLISGTRLIFHEENKEEDINVTNTGKSPALIQSWIDDGDENKKPNEIEVPFFIPNGLVNLAANSVVTLRVFSNPKINALPKEHESLFYLNVVDIPPEPSKLEKKNNGIIQFVVRSRIKLIYRPKGLEGNPNFAVNDLIIQKKNNNMMIKNPTPYYININKIQSYSAKEPMINALTIPPFSDRSIKLTKKNKQKIMIESINDLGGTYNRDIIL